ncbi:hypothetical protein MA04_04046 [Alcanivorax balearicus MACL04]|uniref:DUF6708 domain-containing protein n=1 Tax=Alloalcanivorax balearicus MACL04 TaxID=1177182 RepID=A0ABT2R4N6_9GAMM|nr:DUF6708 domain-containing protein [Alloalcanivorax balearicus]MCU5784746.1 hypothetical protein [Alloalcanivorax balearicus MACL04]
MYFFEWMLWWGTTLAEEGKDEVFGKDFMEENQAPLKAALEEEYPPLEWSVSDHPRSRGPVYAFNDTYLEMRCGSLEHYRGLITPLVLTLFLFGFGGAYGAINLLLNGPNHNGIADYLIGVIGVGGITAGFWYCFFKFKFYIPIRWELFTHRRLLIRFNRKTKQVHLHRPKYAGGVVTMPWDKIIPIHEGAGMRLVLAWMPHRTGQPFVTFAAVGKRAGTAQDLLDEWEFIRRYMEEGPKSVPQPRVRSKMPWPWYSLEPQFEGLWPILRHGDWKLWLGKLLMSPAFLILGAGHWVSQLLCWEPRWPKIIREAGQPGKPTPKLTTAEDYDPETCRRLYLNADLWVPKDHDPDAPAKEEESGSQWLP